LLAGVTDPPVFRIDIGGEAVEIPAELPLLPVRDTAVFPGTTRPLNVGRARSLEAVRQAARGDGFLAILTQRVPDVEDPLQEDLYDVGTVCKVAQMVDTGTGISVIVVGLVRFRLLEMVETHELLKARIEVQQDHLEDTAEVEAARRAVQHLAKEVVSLREDLPDEFQEVLDRIEDPARLADLVGFGATLSIEEKVALLRQPDVLVRLRVLIRHLTREIRVAQVSKSFAERAAGEIDERQRKTMLREQLRKIQGELGEADDQIAEVDELRERIEEATLPDSVREVAESEANRLAGMPAHSPERSVIRTYIEWILDLPWETETDDNLDIAHARVILDEDHYGLETVKERILEYLAVRRLIEAPRGPILCFLGPPGVGKTSLGKSIARAMGRKFIRTSLGGVRDEAEIRGHRRTYVGALPGRILQNLKRAGSRNPVFMLDEIDKVGMDYRGDPSSALLEVLDPEQNSTFSDHYLELPFDLSHVFFVTTANRTDTIPPPLLDRMEVIELPGYTAREKLRIANAFLAPRQLEEHGLGADAFSITEDALLRIIEEYTREAGVRSLERQIAALVRKSALKLAEGEKDQDIQVGDLATLLGPPPYTREVVERVNRPGVSMGLVWTPVGGDIVFVEAALMEGKPRLRLTGQLGDVMRESAETALSYLQANAETLGIRPEAFGEHQVHIHVPAGGLKKDGPSAGVTLLVALTSLFTGSAVRGSLAMTGEITLRGQVLPVGGIKEKVLAAHRAGVKEIILPTRNEKDLEEVPEEVCEALKVHVVDHAIDAIKIAIPGDD
jgi:ATP-dependent Lon protease